MLVHKYGPHIFHTKSDKIYNYLSNFTEWTFYEHKVLGTFDDLHAPIPFNYETLDRTRTGNKGELKQRLQTKYNIHALKVPAFCQNCIKKLQMIAWTTSLIKDV